MSRLANNIEQGEGYAHALNITSGYPSDSGSAYPAGYAIDVNNDVAIDASGALAVE